MSAWCQNGRCYLPPRMPKIHRFPPFKSEATTPSPGRFRPRQRGRQLIVMSLGGGIKRNSRNRPHGAKMVPVAHPPEPKSEAATPSSDHSSPNPATLRLIVMFSMLETGRNDQIQPSGCKMKATPPPPPSPPTKIIDLPSLKRSLFSVPWLIPPIPSRAEVDCGVFEE